MIAADQLAGRHLEQAEVPRVVPAGQGLAVERECKPVDPLARTEADGPQPGQRTRRQRIAVQVGLRGRGLGGPDRPERLEGSEDQQDAKDDQPGPERFGGGPRLEQPAHAGRQRRAAGRDAERGARGGRLHELEQGPRIGRPRVRLGTGRDVIAGPLAALVERADRPPRERVEPVRQRQPAHRQRLPQIAPGVVRQLVPEDRPPFRCIEPPPQPRRHDQSVARGNPAEQGADLLGHPERDIAADSLLRQQGRPLLGPGRLIRVSHPQPDDEPDVAGEQGRHKSSHAGEPSGHDPSRPARTRPIVELHPSSGRRRNGGDGSRSGDRVWIGRRDGLGGRIGRGLEHVLRSERRRGRDGQGSAHAPGHGHREPRDQDALEERQDAGESPEARARPVEAGRAWLESPGRTASRARSCGVGWGRAHRCRGS